VNLTSTAAGPNTLSVSGDVSSSLITALTSTNVSVQQAGVAAVAGASPLQNISLHRLNIGDTATIGGLTFTAASDLSASEVAAIFANKTAASSPTDPSASLGSFTGSLSGFTGSNDGSSVLTLTGTSQVPTDAVSVSGNVISIVALSSSDVSIIEPGSTGTPGIYAQQTVNLSDLDAGNSATIGGLTFTARTSLTSTELATIFATRIAEGREADSNLGTFSGTFVGGFTGASAGSTLTLTGPSFGPMDTVSASEMVSGAANAPEAIALISQFISQISSTQASLSAASTNLNTALDSSTKLATSSQKTVDDIQNIDLTALQANLQALSVQQSLDFQVISQMNAAASSLLAIFR
jgi:flagellin-like hook-associated protein FlgL